ncbi:MAG TPA: hypothetical protein PK997_05570 [Candidatus Omnitrophota bacterium]|nr:MAG: hypothetical protein BWY49_01315 [Candidatus Omnitrophica bacterium ADurb.Bin314]HOE68104.1 hypothetical protein [Candidatus Omnitrophota bacterium]HQB94663.1 hypothetical protein [Candidatus Omnitrophota bacterium]
MAKIKIEIRKPQQMMTKETAAAVEGAGLGDERSSPSPFFGFLLLVTYALCGVAIWFAVQAFLKK